MNDQRKYSQVQEFLDFYLKGIFMGMADIVPGVSGGTIALIVGIYERLIFGFKNIKFRWIWYLLSGKLLSAKHNIKQIDFSLFIPLGLGIATAFLVFSEVITFFIKEFQSNTYSFFLGLILASSYFIYIHIEKIDFKSLIAFLIGAIAAYYFVAMQSIQTNHTLPIIFLSAFLAICAMILPGISGAFLLLVLGQYSYLLEALHSFNLKIIFAFIAGAALGFISFSKVVAWFLKKFKSLTMSFLLGLMIGALRLPYLNIVENDYSKTISIIFALLGFFLVFGIEKLGIRSQ